MWHILCTGESLWGVARLAGWTFTNICTGADLRVWCGALVEDANDRWRTMMAYYMTDGYDGYRIR